MVGKGATLAPKAPGHLAHKASGGVSHCFRCSRATAPKAQLKKKNSFLQKRSRGKSKENRTLKGSRGLRRPQGLPRISLSQELGEDLGHTL